MRTVHSSRLITKLSRARALGRIALIAIAVAAAATAGCDSSSQVTSGPSPVKCQVSLAMSSPAVDAAGGAGNVAVTTQPECTWDVAAEANWISEVSPTSGQGSAEVKFRVSANPLPSPRQGDIVINGDRVRVVQAASPCRFEIAPRSQALAAAGGPGTVAVTAASGCAWTATSQTSWLSLTQPVSGDGSGTLSFTVAPNSGSDRTATVSVADQTFTVTQAGAAAAGCSFAIDPTSRSTDATGAQGIPVTVSTTEGCSWAASSNAPWIVVTALINDNRSGSVTLSVNANTGAARTGTVTIAGRTFTVSQAAVNCTYMIAPTSQSVAAAGGAGTSVVVSTTTGCTWTASSNASWLTITSGASGTGNGTVGFTVAANTGAARNGTLTVAGQPFTVTQAAGVACTYGIAPSSQSIAALGGAGTPVVVSTSSGCTWTAGSNAPWLTITSGASGTGNGTVGFSVAVNIGAARTGTLTIAGQTFTVTQQAVLACVYVIAPTSQSFNAGGGTGVPIVVTTTPGCTWTAASNDSWITVTSGASGSGPGTVGFTVAAKSGGSMRSGTLTVAGQTFTVSQ